MDDSQDEILLEFFGGRCEASKNAIEERSFPIGVSSVDFEASLNELVNHLDCAISFVEAVQRRSGVDAIAGMDIRVLVG